MTYKEIVNEDAEVFKFNEEGEEFEGIYRGVQEFTNEDGDGKFYKFDDVDDPELHFIIFESSVLKSKMSRVPLDAKVKIVYLGKKPSKRNAKFNYKDFAIYVDTQE